jgi:hypothetical protein
MAVIDLRVNEALREAWNDLSAYMARRFTQEITAEKWEWPRGESPRDIVDTGNLRKSLRVTQPLDPKKLQTDFTWTAPYAGPVHDGAVFKANDAEGNPRTAPARPWTRPVLYDRARIQAYFRARFAMAMRNRTPSAGSEQPGGAP